MTPSTDRARCFYCDRDGQQLEPCCDRHPGNLACTDIAGCRDFSLAALKAAEADRSGTPPAPPR